MKYGIRVPFDGSELWVMQDTGEPWPNNQRVMLFDTVEAAEAAAQSWSNYTVAQYHDAENFDWENLAYQQM
jgi:hypothetical protein